jgi:hypothetical protein
MVGFYEKLGDATTLVNVIKDFGSNWRDWRSTEDSVKSDGQSGQIVAGVENSRFHDNQHISGVVLPKVENPVISGAFTGQMGWPIPSREASIKNGSNGPLNEEVTYRLC